MKSIISVLINVSGAIVAVVSLIISYATNQKLRKQQEIINDYKIKQYTKEECMKKKADFTIKCTYKSKFGFDNIRIINIGRSTAINITIHTSELSDDVACDKKDNINVPSLNPGAGIDMSVLINNPQRYPELRITWDDDFKLNNEKWLSLSL